MWKLSCLLVSALFVLFAYAASPVVYNVTATGNEGNFILVTLNVSDTSGETSLCSGLVPFISSFPSAGSFFSRSLSPITRSSPFIRSCDGSFYYRAPANGAYTPPLTFTYGALAGSANATLATVNIILTTCTSSNCSCGDGICDSNVGENCGSCATDCQPPCAVAPETHNMTVAVSESNFVRIDLNVTDPHGATSPCNGLTVTIVEFPQYGRLYTSDLAPINSSSAVVCDNIIYYAAPASGSYPAGASISFSYTATKNSLSTFATISFLLSACSDSSCGCGDGICDVANEEQCKCAADCSNSSAICSNPTEEPHNEGDERKGKIAVIVIGACFGLLIVGVLIVSFLRRHKGRRLSIGRRTKTQAQIEMRSVSQNDLLRSSSASNASKV